MRFEYDLDAGAAYVAVSDLPVARTAVVDDVTLVDLDAAGGLAGIELVGLGESWPVEEILSRYPMADPDAALLRAVAVEGMPRISTWVQVPG